jgi:hypothetical protein
VQHLHACHVRMIFLKFSLPLKLSHRTNRRLWTLAHGQFFLATPGEFPDCMEVQSGFLFERH